MEINELHGKTPSKSFTSDLKDNNETLRINIYELENYWYFLTQGLKENYKFEYILKLKKDSYLDEEAELEGIAKELQSIASNTFNIGITYSNYDYLYINDNYRIGTKEKSNLIGFITIPENNLSNEIEFIKLVGITKEELKSIQNKKLTIEELYKKINNDITDYNRKSTIN